MCLGFKSHIPKDSKLTQVLEYRLRHLDQQADHSTIVSFNQPEVGGEGVHGQGIIKHTLIIDVTLDPRGGGVHLPQVWASTVKLTPKAVAVISSGRRAVILKALYSEGVGHLERGIPNYHYGP